MSGIVWSIGINRKVALICSYTFHLRLGNADSFFISSIVWALSSLSFIDHFFVISCLSSVGHLHHTQAYLEFAALIPMQSAKKI